MNKPHIHAELIKKWADNPELPVYFFNIRAQCWEKILDNEVHWDPNITYHVGDYPLAPRLKVIRRQYNAVIPQAVQKNTLESGLNGDSVFYVPDFSTKGYREIKPNSQLDPIFTEKGLIFDTPEAAVKALQVMLEGF